MSKALFNNLKKVGVDEATAHEVSVALDPQRYVSREHVVEAITAMSNSLSRHQKETEKCISAMCECMSLHNEDTQKNIAAMYECMSLHRHELQKNATVMRDSISVYRNEVKQAMTSINRQLLVFGSVTMMVFFGLLIRPWH